MRKNWIFASVVFIAVVGGVTSESIAKDDQIAFALIPKSAI